MNVDLEIDRYLQHLRVERALSGNTLSAYGRDLATLTAHADAANINRVADIDLPLVVSWLRSLPFGTFDA